jgi:hypothetical protein
MFRYSKYRDFDTVKQELETECSTSILMTTREDFDASVEAFDLKKTGMGPKKNKISMANADGQIRTDTISNFLKGYNRNLTGQQKEEVRQQLVATNRLVFVREQVSIQDLKCVFADDIEIVDLTTMQECGPADCYFGYFNGEQGDSVFVGLQVTHANSRSDKAFKLCTVHKSKSFIIRQVCELGFVFIAMLYLDSQCRGILLLTPHDEALIRSLPEFDKMKLIATRGKRKARKGSLAFALESCIFLWSADNKEAVHKRIVDIINAFLAQEDIRKYSVFQLESMMSENHRIEATYIRSFKTIVQNAQRMNGHLPGDLQFVQNDSAGVVTMVTMEMKLCCPDRTSTGFDCLLYNNNHDMECWVNRVSVFACVVLASDDATREQRMCNPEVFKYVFHAL